MSTSPNSEVGSVQRGTRSRVRALCILLVTLTLVLAGAPAYAVTVTGGIGDKYRSVGGESGRLGLPLADEVQLNADTWLQRFEHGEIYYNRSVGAHQVWGGIRDKFGATGWENGRLGIPVTDEFEGGNSAWVQDFAGGNIFWHPWYGGHTVWGAIRTKYGQLGWERGRLGAPVTDEFQTQWNHYVQNFAGGSIYYRGDLGAHMVWGGIMMEYARHNWELGDLGGPTSDEYTISGGWAQDFEHGQIRIENGSYRVRYWNRVDCSVDKCVALTFDDGPGPYTQRLLNTLTSKGARATFFTQGAGLRNYPGVARQIVNTPGMEIANHTLTHPSLPGLSESQIRQEIAGNHDLIQSTTGARSTLFRPPYGARNSTVDRIAGESGEAVILWSVDTLDWQSRNAAAVRAVVNRDTRNGSIVLMHDIHSTTVDAVPGIVDDLQGQGYTLVTVSELLGSPVPGRVYTQR
ncbi:polysaccharide deacetylase family protein [Granulicoccus phenolivorans]|uniref:polysaccharide deacetylase family protein n=1 Tax=Granulicoccus phenolivorans TaxID=266854 RepID=UPI00041A19BC|nr:polysaccharide deacetylase family protein [Granulicoccus phenolivorans]